MEPSKKMFFFSPVGLSYLSSKNRSHAISTSTMLYMLWVMMLLCVCVLHPLAADSQKFRACSVEFTLSTCISLSGVLGYWVNWRFWIAQRYEFACVLNVSPTMDWRIFYDTAVGDDEWITTCAKSWNTCSVLKINSLWFTTANNAI